MNFTSSAVELVNPSYAQAPYVHPQTAGKPLEPPYIQNIYQQPLVCPDFVSFQRMWLEDGSKTKGVAEDVHVSTEL